jgi:hypothetical protein
MPFEPLDETGNAMAWLRAERDAEQDAAVCRYRATSAFRFERDPLLNANECAELRKRVARTPDLIDRLVRLERVRA